MAQNAIILTITDSKTTRADHSDKNDPGHLFLFQLIFSNYEENGDTTLAIYTKILLILEICQICCSVLVWFFFITKQGPLVYKKASDRIADIDRDTSASEVAPGFDKIKSSTVKKEPKRRKVMVLIRNFCIYAYCLLFDPLILYYLCYTTFAILGMFNPVFIAILLLDVFFRFCKKYLDISQIFLGFHFFCMF